MSEPWELPGAADLPSIRPPAGYVQPAMKRVRDLLASMIESQAGDVPPPVSVSTKPPKVARARYFTNPADQRRYYGIKRNIGYRTKYPLTHYWDFPVWRGGNESRNLVGSSYKTATAEQRKTRRLLNMSGRGLYRGRGNFFDDASDWVYSGIRDTVHNNIKNKHIAEAIWPYNPPTEWRLMHPTSKLLSGKGLYRGRGGFFGGLAGLLTGQGWKAGSDAGDRLWNTVGGTVSKLLPKQYQVPLQTAMTVSDAINPLGQMVATHYGKGLYGKRRMTGRGAYATNHIIQDSGATASAVVPRFSTSDVTQITLSNREYIRDIYAPLVTSAFDVQNWSLNPGLADSFPWLSQLAINFEEYEIIQLIYTFKSTVADFASASGQVGQIVMATQYNPNSDPFADKEEMMLYDGGMSCKTTESLVHGIECDPAKNAGAAQKYIRAGTLPPTEDLKNYDLGRTSLAVINCPSTYAGQQLGELWVSYTVKLRKPKFASGNAYNIRRDVFTIDGFNFGGNQQLLHPPVIPLGARYLFGSRNSLGASLSYGSQNPTTASADSDDMTFMTPTVLPSAYTENLVITFPDSYSGVLALKILTRGTLLGEKKLNLVASNKSTMFRYKDIPLVYTQGDDGLIASNDKSWSHIKYDTYDGASQGQMQIELHMRLLPANKGLKNVLVLAYQQSYAEATDVKITVDISQYNTFLSIQDNGSNDKLDFTNALTLQRENWPA